jgi:PhoPQ-activated pathogenicity-related protein
MIVNSFLLLLLRFDDPNMIELQKIEDPYFYFDRLTLPKLIVNAVGDEFQQPDDTSNWWSDLPEPKHFLMVPNAEHSMATGILEIVPVIGTWITRLLGDVKIPTFDWDIDKTNGDITVDLTGLEGVKKVEKFWAHTCNGERRDFRFANIDDPCPCGVSYEGTCTNLKSFWTSEEMVPQEEGGSVFVAHHDVPEDGKWAAFMIQVTYEKPADFNIEARPGFIPIAKQGELVFTTEVSIVPDVFPYDDCSGESCAGVLV